MEEMDWRIQHGKVIEEFLQYLNQRTDHYILKGGTALAQCYRLNRFSEDIDLDGHGKMFMDICHEFAQQFGYECRDAKDTDTVKRCMIHYGGIKPLKIEMSARRKSIPAEEVTKINGISVYTINTLALLKASAYQQRDKIRDLFDVTFIINNYYESLSTNTQFVLQNALEYKGLEHFDYITNNQQDELIDVNVLAEQFLAAYEAVGLLITEEEKENLLETNEYENKEDTDYDETVEENLEKTTKEEIDNQQNEYDEI